MRKSVGQRIPEKEIANFQFIGEKKVNQSRLYCSISGNKRMSLDKQSYHVIVHLTINRNVK